MAVPKNNLWERYLEFRDSPSDVASQTHSQRQMRPQLTASTPLSSKCVANLRNVQMFDDSETNEIIDERITRVSNNTVETQPKYVRNGIVSNDRMSNDRGNDYFTDANNKMEKLRNNNYNRKDSQTSEPAFCVKNNYKPITYFITHQLLANESVSITNDSIQQLKDLNYELMSQICDNIMPYSISKITQLKAYLQIRDRINAKINETEAILAFNEESDNDFDDETIAALQFESNVCRNVSPIHKNGINNNYDDDNDIALVNELPPDTFDDDWDDDDVILLDDGENTMTLKCNG